MNIKEVMNYENVDFSGIESSFFFAGFIERF